MPEGRGTWRCSRCMSEISDWSNPVCPFCGCDNANTEQSLRYALRKNTLLNNNRYLVGEVLGEGGFAITYIGFDRLLATKVAIKEYFPHNIASRDSDNFTTVYWNSSMITPEQRQGGFKSFLREAQKAAKIEDVPSVVGVRDTFESNNTAYIVMSYVEGETLKSRLFRTGTTMDEEECVQLLAPMISDLGRVHSYGIIHRDISPDNIMIRADGSVRLLDLGAAKDVNTGSNLQSQMVVKNGFSPPEQYMEAGSVGPWTDVYAMSATIYYCLTARVLPSAMDRLMDRSAENRIQFPESVSPEVAAVLRHGFAPMPGERIQSMGQLLSDLQAALAKRKKKKKKREKIAVAAGGAAAAGSAVYGTNSSVQQMGSAMYPPTEPAHEGFSPSGGPASAVSGASVRPPVPPETAGTAGATAAAGPAGMSGGPASGGMSGPAGPDGPAGPAESGGENRTEAGRFKLSRPVIGGIIGACCVAAAVLIFVVARPGKTATSTPVSTAASESAQTENPVGAGNVAHSSEPTQQLSEVDLPTEAARQTDTPESTKLPSEAVTPTETPAPTPTPTPTPAPQQPDSKPDPAPKPDPEPDSNPDPDPEPDPDPDPDPEPDPDPANNSDILTPRSVSGLSCSVTVAGTYLSGSYYGTAVGDVPNGSGTFIVWGASGSFQSGDSISGYWANGALAGSGILRRGDESIPIFG